MNPYESLPPEAFWRPAVADRSMFEVEDLWQPKFPINPTTPVVTFGSCFAQHIGNALKGRGYNWLITENAPPSMAPDLAKTFNYGVFSARTGNIYTTSLLLQWTSWAFGKSTPPDEIWEKDGRFYDPFRPAIEPNGFESREEVLLSRAASIAAFRDSIVKARCFIFTLGLTESWVNEAGGYEYPMCPGTVAGTFDETRHVFKNQGYGTVRENLIAALQMMRQENPKLHVLLTVSPVPLTATRSGKHVIVATMYSKSVLRAVAGALVEARPWIDYFPSYEIINSPVFRGAFFGPNQRSVTSYGVDFVMSHVFRGLASLTGTAPAVGAAAGQPKDGKKKSRPRQKAKQGAADVVCEEELLAAFGKPT